MVNSSHLAVMLRAVALGLLVSCLAVSVSASDNDFVNCNCDDEGSWSIQSILECQRVSDFLIAIAYFSIPIELLYFVSCSNFPFKWVLLQFIAFIVLCGLTHLINAWTYYGPHSAHSFQLMLALTISKFLTALVSCATAITLLTLFPLILKVKVRELFLRQNVLELDQEVGMMKIKKEASWHVRMLTQEIRKSLDKHNILYTTLVELSKTLDLHNCAVWMPNENRTEMNLTHELKGSSSRNYSRTIPINDPNVLEIRESKRVRILRPDSALGAASSGESSECGAVAAIRMPMLRVSNFKGGTPQLVDTPYAILVLVLPMSDSRVWTYHEMEIVEVVADQVAVALSHAAVLEESQLMREKLREQNRALQQAQKNAMMASQARYSFQKVMSNGMRRPMHSILGLLSTFENMSLKQRIIVDTMVKTSYVLSTLITDVMEMSAKDNGRFPLEMRPFQLHSMIKEASCLAKCLCVYKGFRFEVDVQSSLPNQVMGDERRAFQVILHMVGSLLSTYNGEGTVIFRAVLESGSESQDDKLQQMWRTGTPDKYVSVRFEFEISDRTSHSSGVLSMIDCAGRRINSNEIKKGLSFNICKKIVQMMQGNIWMSMNPINLAESMTLVLRFQVLHSLGRAMYVAGNLLEQPNSNSEFRGLRVVVADDDNVNRTVTAKLLQKLGCQVSTVSSGFDCLSTLGSAENPFQVVVLDLHMPEMDGFEVAMRIRKFHNPNWPLIIALTASAEEAVWEKCLQMGMNGLIRKPVILKGMSDELRRVLQRAGEVKSQGQSGHFRPVSAVKPQFVKECEGRESDAVSRQTLTTTGAKARALCSQIGEDEKMKKAEYFSKDFDWDELRVEVENDPSFSYHLLPFQPSLSVAEQGESQPWNDFHHRHSSGKFFKERRYLLQEFPELVSCEENSRVLEVGCGNGSTVLPMLRGNEKVTVYACDWSTEALERAKETIYASNIVSIEHRFHTFCCDFSASGFPTWLTYNPCQANFEQTSDGRGNSETCLNDSSSLKESRCCIGGVDFVTLIFTLSALSLQRMPKSIKECFSVMRPGGMLLFRDYGLYDMSMLRFEMDKRVGFREYMRSDGTRSYFFALDTVRDLFMGAGFIELELEYCCVKSLNRRNGKSMRRVWVHGKFQKPV